MALTQEQLFQRQQKLNGGLQAASGFASIIGQGVGMVQEAKNINTNAPGQQFDQFGRPVFNLGDFTQQVGSINPQGSKVGERLSGAAQGALAGAAIGGPAAPITALLGAGIGALSQTIFGRRRKRIQEKKKTLAQTSLFNAQRMFNSSMEDYNAQQSAQSLYNEQQYAYQNRVGNVYQALS